MRSAAIIALTGGGMMARFSTRVLESFQDVRTTVTGKGDANEPLRECFDLMAGTSAGALCVAGLVVGRTPAELSRLLDDEGPKIFPRVRWPLIRHWRSAKYPNKPLIETVEMALDGKNIRLGDLDTNVAFPAFNETDGVPVVLTNTDETCEEVLLSDAVLASAAAPSYFRAHRIKALGNRRYIDGGVFSNAPDLSAITVARNLWPSIALGGLQLISVGTTAASTRSPFEEAHDGAKGLFDWMGRPPARLLKLVMRGQVDHSVDLLTKLQLDTFLRIDALVEPTPQSSFELDDASSTAMEALVTKADEAINALTDREAQTLQKILGRVRTKNKPDTG